MQNMNLDSPPPWKQHNWKRALTICAQNGWFQPAMDHLERASFVQKIKWRFSTSQKTHYLALATLYGQSMFVQNWHRRFSEISFCQEILSPKWLTRVNAQHLNFCCAPGVRFSAFSLAILFHQYPIIDLFFKPTLGLTPIQDTMTPISFAVQFSTYESILYLTDLYVRAYHRNPRLRDTIKRTLEEGLDHLNTRGHPDLSPAQKQVLSTHLRRTSSTWCPLYRLGVQRAEDPCAPKNPSRLLTPRRDLRTG